MRTDVLKLSAAIALLYALVATYEPPDFDVFLYPWLEHIRTLGPIGAFSEPFGNYSPPYLYLLALFSLLPLPAFVVLKLLAVVCLGWLAFGVFKLVQSLGGEDPLVAALFALALPTVFFNGPLLGQCDSLWAGSCLLALVAAMERRFLAMAAWAGLAFAFKAQAAFIAPVILGVVIRERKWLALPIPALIYFLAILPAWLAGWPLSDLLTIYTRQAALSFDGNAPNLWALVPQDGVVGYALALAAAAWLVLGRGHLLNLALLSAIVLPFLLPKMHERFFFLAEALAFVAAYIHRDRISIAVCALTQIGTVIAMFAYLRPAPALLPFGAIAMTGALVFLIWEERTGNAARATGSARLLRPYGLGRSYWNRSRLH